MSPSVRNPKQHVRIANDVLQQLTVSLGRSDKEQSVETIFDGNIKHDVHFVLTAQFGGLRYRHLSELFGAVRTRRKNSYRTDRRSSC